MASLRKNEEEEDEFSEEDTFLQDDIEIDSHNKSTNVSNAIRKELVKLKQQQLIRRTKDY